MANAQSSNLMNRARNHLAKAEERMSQASSLPNWATELRECLRCILDADLSTTPAVMQSARKAQEGQTDGKH